MRYLALAADYDGTLATTGSLSNEVERAHWDACDRLGVGPF